MDKNFIENCKFLKQHFTKLTQADTTAQSKCKNSLTSLKIINDAEKLLLSERIDELGDESIEQIREKSVNQYARIMQKYNADPNFRICKKEKVKWNDEIFQSSLPHPKNNTEFLKQHQKYTDIEIDDERKKFEELANIILGKFDTSERNISKLDTSERNISKLDQDKKKITTQENHESEKTKIINFESEESETKREYIDIEDIKDTLDLEAVEIKNSDEKEFEDIPELIITGQRHQKIGFLDVKKINIEDKENTEDFDNTNEDNIEVNKEAQYNTEVKLKKNTNENRETKIHNANKKINNFFDLIKKLQENKINKSKSDLTNQHSNPEIISTKVKPKSSVDAKVASYEHRFKAQKDIIEMQKQKLDEQNKLIEELKLNRIKKDVQDSLQKAKQIQKNIVSNSKQKYKHKPEAKSESTGSESTDNELNLSLNFNKAPKIVKMMEQRAIERHEKRLLIQERKRLIEEEKKRLAEELVNRKLKEETEEKQERAKRLKQQRELVRQMELKKQVEKKRYLRLYEIAMEHSKKKLKQFTMQQFKMLIYNVKIRSEIAKRFYENNIVIKCFTFWRNFVSNIVNKKIELATNLYSKKLLQKTMQDWKSYQLKSVQHNQVANDRYEMSLQAKSFVKWHKLICNYRVQHAIDAKKADKYYRRVLLFHCFENWRSLPAIMQIERVQNERKRKWRLRVAEILTDYDPLKNYDI